MKKTHHVQVLAWQQCVKDHAHYVVDGEPYPSASAVFRAACARGYTGEFHTIQSRLTRGDLTWERLLRPLDQRRARAASTTCKKKRDEMADVIAALDARKKEMGL